MNRGYKFYSLLRFLIFLKAVSNCSRCSSRFPLSSSWSKILKLIFCVELSSDIEFSLITTGVPLDLEIAMAIELSIGPPMLLLEKDLEMVEANSIRFDPSMTTETTLSSISYSAKVSFVSQHVELEDVRLSRTFSVFIRCSV
jgi:hypothetical protein